MSKDDLTIGLYGINGVYNYGCEAIVRGTEIILREKYPDVTIKYASPLPKDDKKRLKGCKVKIVKREKYPLLSVPGFGKILAHTIGMPFYPCYDEKIDWFDDCDAIFSIGGDLYTIPSNYEDKSMFYFLKYIKNPSKIPLNYQRKLFGNAYNPLIHFGDMVLNRKKKFIIWGSSIGPFEKSEYAKRIFKNHLLNVDLITSREPETTKYLENLGIMDNVKECADPAFVVSSGKKVKQHNDHLVIGLNLSPLSLNQIFNDEAKEKILLKQTNIIEELIAIYQAEIILIPHVVSQSINDDDLRFLKQLISRVNDKFRDNVYIIDDDPGFIGIKNILNKCDVLITARMHCAINALEAGVPTIFISYSKKSEGMACYVYGNKKWVIPLKNFESANILTVLDTLLNEKENIESFLVKKMEHIKLDAFKPLEILNDMF